MVEITFEWESSVAPCFGGYAKIWTTPDRVNSSSMFEEWENGKNPRPTPEIATDPKGKHSNEWSADS